MLCQYKLNVNFRCKNYDAIVTMSQELNIEDDSSLLLKCSNFFMSQGHYDNAVNLLAMANKVHLVYLDYLFCNLLTKLFFFSLKKLWNNVKSTK